MSRILTLSTSMLALMVGIGVANAQIEEPKQDGQRQMQRQESGGDQGQDKKRGTEQSGNKAEEPKSGEKRERVGQDGKSMDGEKRERVTQDGKAEDGDIRKKGQKTEQGDSDRSQNREKRADDKSDGDQKAKSADSKDQSGDRPKRAEGGKKRPVNVNITEKNRTVIRERVINQAPKRYSRNEVNFNISVGSAIPDTFVIYDVSPSFVEIVPEYEGYDYIVVGDTVLIIDPETREIVDVIQV
jgi:hypothetical protein